MKHTVNRETNLTTLFRKHVQILYVPMCYMDFSEHISLGKNIMCKGNVVQKKTKRGLTKTEEELNNHT